MQKTFLFFLVLIGVIALWAMKPNTSTVPDASTPPLKPAPTVTAGDLIVGPKNAKNTIVEFGDYTCPACAIAQQTVNEILQSRNDVRFVWKDLPHMDAITKSMRHHIAAQCASRQGAFAAFHNALFEQLPKTDEEIAAIASQLNLNQSAFSACQQDKSILARIRANKQEAARIGVTGTPEFYINGKKFSGKPTVNAFMDVLRNAP